MRNIEQFGPGSRKLFPLAVVIAVLTAHCGAESVGVEVKGESFVADFYCVKSPVPKPGILVLSGSEGGRPDERMPNFLATNGWAVLAVAYFKAPGLPPTLQMIPLEYFDAPLTWMEHNANIRPGGVLVMGGSKGAELALLLASKRPGIKGVIATAPSSVVWPGLQASGWPADSQSSWSFRGKPVAYVPFDYRRGFDTNDPLAAVKFFKTALEQKAAVKKASIRVEKINGPILLLSGKADEIWPSAQMADAICQRLRTKNFRFNYENMEYPDANHTFNEHRSGGTPDGNARAGADAELRITKFLHTAAGAGGAPARQ